VRVLSAILRVAESLDRSHKGIIQHAVFRSGKDSLRLELQVTGDCQLELWGLEDRMATFEAVFKRPVQIQIQKVENKVRR